MKRLVSLFFSLFLIFLVVSGICPFYKKINYIFIGLFLILSLVIIMLNRKKIKLDIIDFLLGLLPLSYLIPYIVHKNVYDISLCIYYILLEIAVTFVLLILRRNMNEKRVNNVLTVFAIIGCICFFVSFIYPIMLREMALLGIFCDFGDTYINSIDRFYGTLMYCNSSALLFLVAIFISIFKIYEDNKNKNLYRVILFINFSGFLSTFSKMLSITFILVLIALLIIKIVMKQNNFINVIKNSFISIIIPSLLFVRLMRTYLINLNVFYFFIVLSLLIILYICLCGLLDFLDTKWKYSSYTYLTVITIIIFGLTIKPISIPLKISHVYRNVDYIISDFILKENKDYEITWNIDGNKDNISFKLYKLYLSDYVPKIEIVKEVKASNINSFKFKTSMDFEYYFIKVTNFNSKANLKIKDLKINNEDYLINSFLVPYQYIHQLDLIKYDRESVVHRFQYYKDSMKIIKNHNSLIGEGYGTFKHYSSKGMFNYITDNPHSYIFELWLNVGIYGPIYVIGLIVFGILNMLKYRYDEKKHIWFCIFCSCMIILPFDSVFSLIYTKIMLIFSFLMIYEKNEKYINKVKIISRKSKT